MEQVQAEDWGLVGLGIEPVPPVHPEPDFFDDLGETEVYLPQSNLPEPLRSLSPWPAMLPRDLALGVESEETILLKYDLTKQDFERLCESIPFRKALALAQREVHENGDVFANKCKAISEDFLEKLYQDFYAERTGVNTRHDLFKTVVRLAGLEPKDVKEGSGAVPQVNIQINL